jgi:polyisoprenoid-binding protein YceI
MFRSIATCIMVLGIAGSLEAAPANFNIDPVHSFVTFKVGHGVGQVYGRFDDLQGSFTLDADNTANDKISVEVKTPSLSTKNAKRDSDVKGAKLLNVEHYPLMTFVSDSVKKVDDTHFDMTGKLTIHGVTKPVSMKLVKTGEKAGMNGKYVAAGETTFTVKRSDYGITAMSGMIGDDVTVMVAIEGIRQ